MTLEEREELIEQAGSARQQAVSSARRAALREALEAVEALQIEQNMTWGKAYNSAVLDCAAAVRRLMERDDA